MKNDLLDFAIPYELYGTRQNYLPDYLVLLRRENGSGLALILEVKGFETEADRVKEVIAKRWVRAVNHHGELGQLTLRVCRQPHNLPGMAQELLA